jgi:thioredoxin-related protein
MKMIFLIIASSLLFNTNQWLLDFDQAKKIAKEDDRLILLNFSGSDWCAPCIKMKTDIFEKPEFLEYADQHLVLVRADFPRHKKNQLEPRQKELNDKLAEQYNDKGLFPLTILLTADGKVIYEWDGYPGKSASEFVKEISSKSNAK